MRSYRLFSSAFLLVLALSAPACSQPERPAQPEPGVLWESRPHPEGDLTYSVQTLVRESFPVQIETIVKVENRSGKAQTLEFPDGCPLLLRVYEENARERTPVWDQSRVLYCTQAIQHFDLEDGESMRFSTRTDAEEILGDSIPAGRYDLTVVVKRIGWPIELDAGSVDLEGGANYLEK